ncbi:siroheme decarboxylase subunit beta [Thalassotalea atypica]|uniref:siroheme decarboxylase subunit beta n=1 Tax=Thalassotalea atypica TaxID=2054316 RepID=UPI0025743998|nr:Lrp/AsnC family transcriptional regulator [Thalassotalea atypica]
MSVSTSQSNALTPIEREYVLLTQNGLPIVARPYHWIAEQLKISVEQVYELTEKFLENGIVRRIAAVPNHYKLGYTYNGMTVWDIADEHATTFGDAVGKLPFVSHCYLRPRKLPSWNFNLFAMVHGKSPDEIEQQRSQIKKLLTDVLVERFHDDEQKTLFKPYDMLTSTQILKKTGLRLKRNSTEKA